MFGKHADGTRYEDNGKTNFSDYEIFVPVFQPADLQNNWPGIMYNMVGVFLLCCCVCMSIELFRL